MSTCISLPGGLDGLKQQLYGCDWLPSSVVLFACNGNVCYQNPAAENLHGLLGHHPYAGPAERGLVTLPALTALLREVCESGRSQTLRHTFYRSRNIAIPLALILRPVMKQDSGQVEGVLLTIGEERIDFDGWHLARLQADKSELREQVKKLSAARAESERIAGILLSEMPIAVVLFDEQRRVIQLNRAAEKLFDKPRRNAIGLHCEDFMSCYTGCRQRCPMIDANQRVELEEVESRNTAGVSRQLLRTAVAFNEGDQTIVLEAFIDVSDRKKAEAKLARYREELENIVAERTAKLEETIEELESFSYSVSHDLRSPLRAIDGFSLALLDEYADKLDETAMDYLSRSRNAAQRMARLIDDLLDLSRIRRTRLKRKPVDISALCEEIAAELRLENTGREVHLAVQPGLCAQAEAGLVRALLSNLIGNAWKFTAASAPAQIEIGSAVIENDEVFYVRDNGEGFPMNYASKLFLPFHVLNPKSPASGTGIGLATAQRIIHRHGGCVWAASEPGKGATFFFTLGD